jgi:kynurenine formamidase
MLRDLGGYLMEFLNLEEIAQQSVHEFLLVAAPLRITGGIGSPINPLAIA